MKRIILLVLMLVTLVSAQHVEGNAYITCTLVDLDSIDLYMVRTPYGAVDLDSVLTVYTDVLPSKVVLPAALMIEPNAGTGMAGAETDSLLIRIYPLVYDWADGEYAKINDYYRYASFGTTGELTTTRTALDWTDGAEYIISLIDDNGTYLYESAAGIVVQVIQRNASTGNGSYTIQPLYKM